MTPISDQKRRNVSRKVSSRPVQIQKPDKGFDNERRQARLIAQADSEDIEIASFLDAAIADLDGWT